MLHARLSRWCLLKRKQIVDGGTLEIKVMLPCNEESEDELGKEDAEEIVPEVHKGSLMIVRPEEQK